MMAARAKALLEGRLAPSVADVADLARPALKHRMALTFAAKAEGESVDRVIDQIAARTAETARAA
jgi:MoxR-like ATPase